MPHMYPSRFSIGKPDNRIIMTTDCLLAKWTHNESERYCDQIIPDGCQDVILTLQQGVATKCVVSPLSRASESVDIPARTCLKGFRLQPGTLVDEQALQALLIHAKDELVSNADWLDEVTHRSAEVEEALEYLGSGIPTVAECARHIGVSVRTLQRQVTQCTGEAPVFWLSLARARRTCRSLGQFEKLSDAACYFGYSDQAHMSREIRRWFGMTPTETLGNMSLHRQLAESGYC